jgi:hypothetical protein
MRAILSSCLPSLCLLTRFDLTDDHLPLPFTMSTMSVPPIDKANDPIIPDAAPSEPTPTFIPAPTTQNVVESNERSVSSLALCQYLYLPHTA